MGKNLLLLFAIFFYCIPFLSANEKSADGTYKFYFESGVIKEQGNRKNGMLIGLRKTFFNNGKVETIGRYINDKADGKFVEFYESGRIKQIRHFKNNQLHGIFIVFYPNGKVDQKIQYINGEPKDGLTKRYANDGKSLIFEQWYKDGNLVKEILYDDNGIVLENTTIKNTKEEIEK